MKQIHNKKNQLSHGISLIGKLDYIRLDTGNKLKEKNKVHKKVLHAKLNRSNQVGLNGQSEGDVVIFVLF